MRWKVLIASGIAAGFAIPAGYATAQYQARPVVSEIEPGPNAMTTSGRPTIRLVVENRENLADVRVTVDGRDVTSRLKGTRRGYIVQSVPLEDGPHAVRLTARDTTLLGDTVDRTWTFAVDTTKPPLRLTAPKKGWGRDATIRGRTEPGAAVSVKWDGGQVEAKAGPDGLFSAAPPLPEGKTRVFVVARDAAGNEFGRFREVKYDTSRPVLKAGEVRTWYTGTASPTFAIAIDDIGPVSPRVWIDGRRVAIEETPEGVRVPTRDLSQGLHLLQATITDAAGHKVKLSKQFGVDTVEKLTPSTVVGFGARGADVKSVIRRLRQEGFWKGKMRTRFDRQVQRAMKRYQVANDLEPTGTATPAFIQKTDGKLVADLSDFIVTVYRDGRVKARFPIAKGSSAFPTPTGTYEVIEMLKNPTWIPPNSPWAAGLEPIPPGSGNPLGTRWIGTSAPAIGFHGTYDDSSVGTAASHGCMRMHIPDVEKMFEMVKVGMPVVIKE